MGDRQTSFRVIAQKKVTAHGSYQMYKDFHKKLVIGDISSKQTIEPMTSLVKDTDKRLRIHYF